MAKYRNRPVVIEAEQWDPDSLIEEPKPHTPDKLGVIWHYGPTGHVCGGIMEAGDHLVTIGDWIITTAKGEKYPCGSNIFEQTYEKI